MVKIGCNDVVFENISAIIFDKDGTLADSESFLRSLGTRRARLIDAQVPGVQEPLLLAFGVENNQINPAGLLAIGTRQENEVAAAAYIAETGRDWVEALAIARSAFNEADTYMQSKAQSTPLFDGAKDLIVGLSASHVKLGMLSSDTPKNVVEFAQTYGLASYFSLLMGVEHPPGKPDPILLHAASKELQVELSSILMIGDSTADIQMARDAGVAGCIGVVWGWTEPLKLQGADVLIESFSELRVMD